MTPSEHIRIRVSLKDPVQQELWAHTLMEEGASGSERTEDELTVYFEGGDKEASEKAISLLKEEGIEHQLDRIPDQDWNRTWEEAFDPVSIGNELLIRAPFHPQEEGYRYEIELEPRRAFGTGHHPTTLLMLQRILSVVKSGDRVLDMGAGTAILAILCEKMGASEVLAIDNEEWAVENAQDALGRNACQKVQVRKGERVPWKEDAFDVILGNIERNVLIEMLPDMGSILRADGRILLSGLKKEDQAIMDEKASEVGLEMSERKERSEWIMLEYRKK